MIPFGTPESFRHLAREILWPRRRLWLLLHVAAALVGLDYWLSSFWFEPDTPLEIRALYRPDGDTQYVAMIANLARGQFGESALYESFGTGLEAFPLGTMVLHISCVAALGNAGFMIADGIAALFYFLSLTLLLSSFGVPKSYARIISLFTAGGISLEVISWLIKKSLLPGVQLSFWGFRLPRPIVSEIPLVLTIALSCALVRYADARASRWVWVTWGASLAWLVQGDIHGAAGIGLFSGPVLLVAACRLKDWRASTLRLSLAFGALCICLVPFFVQNLVTDFEVTRRWGAFSLSRLSPPSQLVLEWPRVLQALVIIGVSAAIRALYERNLLMRFPRPPEVPGALGQAALLSGLVLAAWLMLPAFVILTGKGLQLYHFPDRFTRILSYAILTALALALQALVATLLLRIRHLARTRNAEALSLALAIASAYTVIVQRASEHTVSYGPPRGGFPGTGAYKPDWIELTRRLRAADLDHAKVLGTFDHATMLWWVGFKPGFLLVPDPFLTSRPDAELEERFVAMAKEVRMSKSHFESIAKTYTSHIFYLSSAKYNAIPLYKISTDDDYTTSQLTAISQSYLLDGFNIHVPRSAVQRLTNLYSGPRERWEHYRKPDVIVVNRHDRTYGHAPDKNTYDLALENSTFQLWTRRAPQ